MTVQQVIEKAVKEGFATGGREDERSDGEKIRAFVLLPHFWQALGKALGWCDYKIPKEGSPKGFFFEIYPTPNWHSQRSLFIDHIDRGKSIESYFEKLN